MKGLARMVACAGRKELTVPEELRGTFAARLADVRAEAGFALWSIAYGADWRRAWSECGRADWLVDAVVLCDQEYEQGSQLHRRMVVFLCELAAELLCNLNIVPTTPRKDDPARLLAEGVRLARVWAIGPEAATGARGEGLAGRGEALAHAWFRRPDTAESRRLVDEFTDDCAAGSVVMRQGIAGVAAYFAAASAISPSSPVRAARAAAIASSGYLTCPELARRVAGAFECPRRLRVELPA